MSSLVESRDEIVNGFYEIESTPIYASDLCKSREVDFPAYHALGAGEVREGTSHRPYSSGKGGKVRHGIIDDLRPTPSRLRKKLQSAGFGNIETQVPWCGKQMTFHRCGRIRMEGVNERE